MKRITACLCLIFLLVSANFINCNEKISNWSLNKNETIKLETSENDNVNDSNNDSGNSSENDDDLEEDWEVYGDPRVKEDVERRKLYRSFKRQFESGQFNFKVAMMQLHEFELKRAKLKSDSTNSSSEDLKSIKNSHFEKAAYSIKERFSVELSNNEKDKGLKLGVKVAEVVKVCVGAFSDKFSGDFCYKTKGNREPSMCQCGYRYYKGNCWENCKEGYLFKKGVCLKDKNDHYTPKFISNKSSSVFLCTYGFYKNNGHCYEDCSAYNMVDCFFYFVPGCSTNTGTCAFMYANSALNIILGVLNIIVAVLSFGSLGKTFDIISKFSSEGLKSVLKKAAESARQKASEILLDVNKQISFITKVTKEVSSDLFKNICKEVAKGMLKRTALGPEDNPEIPDQKDVVVEAYQNIVKETALALVPGMKIKKAIGIADEKCQGNPVDVMKCAGAVMDVVILADPTGLIAGAFLIAKAFMHPACDDKDGTLPDPDTDKQED